jgi:hypothetical protein
LANSQYPAEIEYPACQFTPAHDESSSMMRRRFDPASAHIGMLSPPLARSGTNHRHTHGAGVAQGPRRRFLSRPSALLARCWRKILIWPNPNSQVAFRRFLRWPPPLFARLYSPYAPVPYRHSRATKSGPQRKVIAHLICHGSSVSIDAANIFQSNSTSMGGKGLLVLNICPINNRRQ